MAALALLHKCWLGLGFMERRESTAAVVQRRSSGKHSHGLPQGWPDVGPFVGMKAHAPQDHPPTHPQNYPSMENNQTSFK